MEIKLRIFEFSDIPKKIEWINNPQNNQFLHYDIPLEYEKTRKWFNNKDNDKRIDFIIEADDIPVGVIGLLAIDKDNRKAEYYITVGEVEYKHRGVASKATELLLQYAFEELKMHKIYLNVDAENIAACKLYEKMGFNCEGTFKEDMLFHGKYIDRKHYAIIDEVEHKI